MATRRNNIEKKQDERILKLEVEFKEYCRKVDRFLGNEFPHFREETRSALQKIDEKIDKRINGLMSKLFFGFVVGIASILILQVALSLFEK